MDKNLAPWLQKLAPCPDSYWFRVEDYLTAAKAMREEARRATGPARAELIETAAQWEAIVREHLDFLAELETLSGLFHRGGTGDTERGESGERPRGC